MMDPKQKYKDYMDTVEPSPDFLAKLKELSAEAETKSETKEVHHTVASGHANGLVKGRQVASCENHKIKVFPIWVRITAACLGIAVGIFAWTFMRDAFNIDNNKTKELALPENNALNRPVFGKDTDVVDSDNDVSEKWIDDSSEQNERDYAVVMPYSYDLEKIRQDARRFINSIIDRTEDDLDWNRINNVEIESSLIERQTAAVLTDEIKSVLQKRNNERPIPQEESKTVILEILEITEKESNGDIPSDSIFLADKPVTVKIHVSDQTITIP